MAHLKNKNIVSVFLIQECLDSISEHKLQQMEDPNFLESSVWQWNPSSTLLIIITGNKNQSRTRSHVCTKIIWCKLHFQSSDVQTYVQEPTIADWCNCSVWMFFLNVTENKAWGYWNWKARPFPWLKGVGQVPLDIPGSPASETWFLSTTCRHKNSKYRSRWACWSCFSVSID